MLMTAADYRESPRAYKPRVFVNENSIESVADEPLLAPGIAGVAVTYDFAHRKEHIPIMTARQGTSHERPCRDRLPSRIDLERR
jgi:4-hydroxybutyryl-CoA dehydratase / vinylacetyl-CoA-Delta-isomerase